MRAAYFDAYAGASGDMVIGALLDAGLELDHLRQQLSLLKLEGYALRAARVTRHGIAATKFDVDVGERAQPHRHFGAIRDLIAASALAEKVKGLAVRAFERLAEAEARVHNTTVENVHFHEVGAVDAIVDIVGAMVGVEALGLDRCYASALRVGYGTVKAAHGILPIPAPGTAELLRGVPVYAGDIEGEFVTPTGAAILTTLCEAFGPMPPLRVERAGYGAGTRDPEGLPNTLRVMIGELMEAHQGNTFERVMVIETNIDDMNPQVYGYVTERAFALGALDVFTTAAQMKKGRPGVLLTVLCARDRLDALTGMLLAETTTLGVRYHEAQRRVLERTIEEVETPYGRARVKVAREGRRVLHVQPEYEDCARLAAQSGTPLIEVQRVISEAYSALARERETVDEKDAKSKEA